MGAVSWQLWLSTESTEARPFYFSDIERPQGSLCPTPLNVTVPSDEQERRQNYPRADCPNCKRVELGRWLRFSPMSHRYLPALLGNILPKAGNFVSGHAQRKRPQRGGELRPSEVPVLTPARMSIH